MLKSSIFTVILGLLTLSNCYGFEFASETPGGGSEIGPDYDADGDNSNTGGGGVVPVPKGRQRLINQLTEQRGFARLDNRQRFDEILRPKARCDRRIRVINGATRIRDKGALVRFQCSYGFHMLGVALAVCVKGKWSDPPPICVRDGCRTLPIPIQGNLRLLYGGGVAMFTCNYGHYLEGERVLTCDGTRWNGTAPECIEIPPVTLSPPSTTFPTIPLEIASPDPEPETENKTASVLLPDPSTINTQTSTFEPDSDTTMKSTSTQIESGNEVPVPSSTVRHVQESETVTEIAILVTERNTEIGQTTVNLPETTMKTIEITTPAVVTSTELIPSVTTTSTESTTITTTATPPTTQITTKAVSVEITTEKVTEFTLVPVTESATVPEVMTTTTITSTPSTSATSTAATTLSTTPFAPTAPETPIPKPSTTIFPSTTTHRPFIPKLPKKATVFPVVTNPKNYPFPKKQTEATRKDIDIENETRKELISIAPSKLDNGHHINPEHYNFAHFLIIIGTILVTIGSVSILGAVLMYCWRKNKGIARARSHDLDGRTLSYNEGTDEILWLDCRDNASL